MLYQIASDKIKVTINDFGAEVVSVLVNGKEMIWQNQDGTWAGHSPVVFPYCGHVQVNYNSIQYKEHLHGFAQFSQFVVEQNSQTKITLKLVSSEETKKYYPFDFNFYVTYSVNGDTLTITNRVVNTSNEPIYFGLGGHESYNLDKDIQNYYVEFNKTEDLVNIASDDNGPLKKDTAFKESSNIIQLDKKYFLNGLTLILESVESDVVTLYDNNGEKIAQTCFKGYNNFLIWTPNNKNCVCLEPWINMPDTNETKSLDIRDKKDLLKLGVGEEKSLTREIKYF